MGPSGAPFQVAGLKVAWEAGGVDGHTAGALVPHRPLVPFAAEVLLVGEHLLHSYHNFVSIRLRTSQRRQCMPSGRCTMKSRFPLQRTLYTRSKSPISGAT